MSNDVADLAAYLADAERLRQSLRAATLTLERREAVVAADEAAELLADAVDVLRAWCGAAAGATA